MRINHASTIIEKLTLAFLLIFIIVGCGGNSSHGSGSYSEYERYDDVDDDELAVDYDDDDGGDYSELEQLQYRLTGEIVTCNKCMGYGMVQNELYGEPEICKFCWISTYMRMQQGWSGFDGRYGQVDAVFNTLPSDYFDDLDWNDGGDYEGSNFNDME